MAAKTYSFKTFLYLRMYIFKLLKECLVVLWSLRLISFIKLALLIATWIWNICGVCVYLPKNVLFASLFRSLEVFWVFTPRRQWVETLVVFSSVSTIKVLARMWFIQVTTWLCEILTDLSLLILSLKLSIKSYTCNGVTGSSEDWKFIFISWHGSHPGWHRITFLRGSYSVEQF